MKTISRYIMTLALLMTAASGAWAEEVTVTFTQADLNGNGTVAKDGVTITPSNNDAHSNANFYDYGSNTFSVDKGTFTKIEIVNCYYGNISGSGWQKIQTGSYRPYPEEEPDYWVYLYTLTWTGEAESVTFTAKVYGIQSIVFTIDKPEVDVTTNKAEGETTFTEATFAMPDYDATVGYDIVRDLAQQTSVNLIIGTGDAATPVTADTRLRIQKVNNVYAPVSALSCTFTDAIENKTILPTGFDDAKLTPLFYKQGENDAWTLVTDINTTTKLPNNLQPGQVYCITLKAADGSYYDGETPQSFTVTLFEGYEVKVPAGEYITYYRDEPLKLDDNETNAELYTISAVGTETATLSGPYDAMKALTPMLVHNKNTEEAKTILLIPCNEPDLALTVAPEFKGTLEATEIAASSATSNNYAFNGKKFVWVMNDLEIGANKAWLSISATSGARVINLVFDDATRIDGVARTAEQSGDYYDLNGRKLAAKPTRKGVYIQNGKKVVVK